MDMALRYSKMTDAHLKQLRSKKYLRVTFLSGLKRGWFDERELRVQKALLKQIDVELAARRAQIRLL